MGFSMKSSLPDYAGMINKIKALYELHSSRHWCCTECDDKNSPTMCAECQTAYPCDTINILNGEKK